MIKHRKIEREILMLRYRINRNHYIISTAVLTVILAFVGYIVIQKPSWSPIDSSKGSSSTTDITKAEQEKTQEITKQKQIKALSLIPGNAITVAYSNALDTDTANKAWETYRRLLPVSLVTPETLPQNSDISSITYAAFPNNTKDYATFSPIAYEIILMTKAEDTVQIMDAIATNKDANTFITNTIQGDVGYIIIAPSSSYQQIGDLIQGNYQDETFDKTVAKKHLLQNNNTQSMYVDISSYMNIMTTYQKDSTNFTHDFLNYGLGLEDNTTWQGTTKDYITWQGEFLTGGINIDAIDIKEFQKLVDKQIELHPIQDTGANGEYGYVTFGMSTVADAISVSKNGQTTGKVVNPHNVTSAPLEAKTIPNTKDATIVFSPQMFQVAYQSVLDSYFIHSVTIKTDGEKASLEFNFYTENDYATNK